MIITSFKARGFRNITCCEMTFSEGTVWLTGDNAQGKTNAVEGMYLFAGGRSFRTASDADLVKFGEEGFHLSLGYKDNTGDHTLSYTYHKGKRKRMVEGYEVHSIKEMMGHFRAVLFTPEHMRIVKDAPEERRSFMNFAISQCYPAYITLYTQMKRAYEERNCLLKQAQKGIYYDKEQIGAWSTSLASYAAKVYLMRKEYIEKLKTYAEATVLDMTDGKEQLSVMYKGDGCVAEAAEGAYEGHEERQRETENAYIKVFHENIDREIGAGTTLYGPMRDDLQLYINGQSVRHFASQGQQRSVVLALKLAEGEVCRRICGEYPVYIFDDVLSELDNRRRAYIFQKMQDKQLILTGCDTVENLPSGVQKILVERGQYVPACR